MSTATRRLVGLYAAIAAAVAVVLAPLLAMSYFATSEGADERSSVTVSAWADPGRDLAGRLLTWASPDRVYGTYVQAFALLFAGVFLCALAARGGRDPRGRSERWGWRIALTVFATFPPKWVPMKLPAAAISSATRGVSARVLTLVAIAFAVSWKPLM